MYIPKNRIIANLYTNNNELVYKNSKQPYNGYYWKTYDGKIFTGKTPNDTPYQELENVSITEENFNLVTPISKIAFTDSPSPLENNEVPYSEQLIIDYSRLKNINLNQPSQKLIPQQYYPSPTSDDYKLGSFTRYFISKINESICLELNENTYTKITQQDNNWSWEIYIPFNIQWTLTGDKEQVYKTNRNVVLLQEKRLKSKSLSILLRNDYLKFYKNLA
jgi:hypothetical protein